MDGPISMQFRPAPVVGPMDLLKVEEQAQGNALMRMKMAEIERANESQNALMTLYRDPANVDPTGNLNPQGMAAVMRTDPATGLKMQAEAAKIAAEQAKQAEAMAKLTDQQLTTYGKKLELLQGAGNAALAEYKAALGKGLPEDQARAIAQTRYSEEREAVSKSGFFSGAEMAKVNPQFDPQRIEAGVQKLMKPKEIIDSERERRRDDQIGKHQDATATETARHNRATEGQAAATAARTAANTEPVGAGGAKLQPGYRWTDETRTAQEPVPGGGADPNTDKAGKTLPASAVEKMNENRQNLKRAENALTLLQGGSVGDLKGDKDATGVGKGILGQTLLNWAEPSGVNARAAMADLGSLVIHQRSGAAVTASEFPRLAPFIPTVNDSPEVARKKVARFVQVYKEVVTDSEDAFREAGYKVPERAAKAAPASSRGFKLLGVEKAS